MNRQQFFNSLRYLHLKPYVENGRIRFSGPSVLVDVRKTLDEMPEFEAELILRIAVKDAKLLKAIKERAHERWAEGFSDSLYMAVLSNFSATGETLEYSDKPDTKQAEILRSFGVPEADIMDKNVCPSVWIKLKPKTDWEAELVKYM